MNKEFLEILERIHDPEQVKNMSDVSRVVIVPALAHLEERISRLEMLPAPKAWTRGEYEAWKNRRKDE